MSQGKPGHETIRHVSAGPVRVSTGRTNAKGATVEERPINVVDFMSTVCRALDIVYTKELSAPGGRPISIVDTISATPKTIGELF